MEQLSEMMSTHSDFNQDEEIGRRGRRTELKTFIIEANSSLPSDFTTVKLNASIGNTGIEEIKIMNLEDSIHTSQFYLDKADKRFCLLHTHSLAESADKLIENLVNAHAYQIDSAWFSSGMLKEISNIAGNRFDGAGIDYETIFASEEDTEVPMEELKVSVFGFRAIDALKNMSNNESVKNYFAYNKVRIIRGDREGYAKDDFNFNGRFSVKSGHSIDDHMALVDSARAMYKDEMETIENFRIGVTQKDDMNIIQGKPFIFELEKPISNWKRFIEVFLNSASPFRLWGLKNKISDNYYQILAIDLHTGHPLDLRND